MTRSAAWVLVALAAAPLAAQSASVGYQVTTADGAWRDALGFSWLGGWGLGDNFVWLSVDDVVTRGREPGVTEATTSVYGEWHARLSLSRITGRRLALGPVGDVMVAAELNFAGDGFLARTVGVGVDWALPGFTIARTSAYVRDDLGAPGVTAQVFTALYRPLRVAGAPLLAIGLMDARGREGAEAADLSVSASLWLDLSGLMGGPPGRARVGAGLALHAAYEATTSREWRPQLGVKFSN